MRVRWYLGLVGLMVAPASFVAGACGGGSSPAECGSGMRLENGVCVSEGPDGGSDGGHPDGGHSDGGEPEAGQPEAGQPDASPDAAPDAAPQDPSFIFGGVTSVSPASKDEVGGTVSLFVTWDPAEDPFTLPSQMVYGVYLATTKGDEMYGAPPAAQVQGASSATLTGVKASTKPYYVVVRATNAGGVQDGNTHEISVVATTDSDAPTLSAAPTVVPRLACQSRVSWAPATDKLTTAPGMRYSVYLADSLADGGTVGSTPIATTLGATMVDVVVPATTSPYHSFVVVAEDAAGNLSAQSPAGSPDMNAISFEASVQPILSAGCVPSCHTVNTTNKLTPVYDEGYAYYDIMGPSGTPTLAHVCVPKVSPSSTSCAPDVNDAGCGTWLADVDGGTPVSAQLVTASDPSCSVLYQVAAQQRMPPKSSNLPPLSACDVTVLHDWIQGGANP